MHSEDLLLRYFPQAPFVVIGHRLPLSNPGDLGREGDAGSGRAFIAVPPALASVNEATRERRRDPTLL